MLGRLPLTPLSHVVVFSRRGGSRTRDLRLIRTPLPPLSYAPVRVGSEGIEPTPCRSKVCCAACYTTTLRSVWCMRFKQTACIVVLLFVSCSVSRELKVDRRRASRLCSTLYFLGSSALRRARSGSPGNRTRRDSVVSRVWATSPRLPLESGTSGSNTPEAEPKTESLPPAPKAGVLPSAPLPDCFVALSVRTAGLEPAISWPPTTRDNQASPRSDRVVPSNSPCGSRTQPTRLERPMTSPEVERAMLCALVVRKVGREVLEPSSAVLQTAAIPSQLPAQVVVRA